MRSTHIFSVIVVTLNEKRHIRRLGEALQRLRLPPGVTSERILVDGGSTDGTPEEARAAGFQRVIVLPGASIPRCRNAGLEAARGDWLAFLDGDCEPVPDWLLRAAPYLETDDAVMVGWPVRPPPNPSWVQEAWHLHWQTKHRATHPQAEPFRLMTTRNMLLNRRAVELTGRFDEDLETGEDTHYALRAWAAGVRVLPVPELTVIHYGEPATLREYFRQQLWHANRRAYAKIVRTTRLRHGGHAPAYATAYLAALVWLGAGLLGTLATGNLLWAAASPVPALLVSGLPAAITASRGKRWDLFFPLLTLYAAYGLARAADLVGLAPRKRSWKTVRAAS